MGWLADYTHRIAPSSLKAAGVTAVMRYLSYPTSSNKVIGKAEYEELRAAGIDVGLNWEFDAHDWLGGAAAGARHGKEAARQARALGHPIGKPIPGSGDFDMTLAQWNSAGRGYAVDFRRALNDGGYGAGVYGPWDLLTWCRDLGGLALFWQAGMSTAWSSHRNKNEWPGAHLRQRYKQMIGTQEVDHNDILRADWNGTGDTFMANLSEAEQQELLRLVRNAERGITAMAVGTDPIKFPEPWQAGQQPAPNPILALTRAMAALHDQVAALSAQVAALQSPVAGDVSVTGTLHVAAPGA